MSEPTTPRAPHTVRRLWIRAAARATPEERPELRLDAGQGVVDDHTYGSGRHVTLIFEEDWADAVRDLGKEIDASARRANLLLSGGQGGDLIGRTVRIGPVVIGVRKETAPCSVMDKAAEGLLAALVPACRGGVWGEVLEGGVISPGDELALV